MGCDIHSYVEIQICGIWERSDAAVFGPPEWPEAGPFGWRSYAVYGFLAGVRNYSCAPVLAGDRGLPRDVSDQVRNAYAVWGWEVHSVSWVSLRELLDYDYDQEFEDRRVTCGGDGGALAEPGEGRRVTLRDFLGAAYFADLEKLATLGPPEHVRVVFWFDN